MLLDAEPDPLPNTKIYGLSQRDMGNLYRELDPTYLVKAPLHFCGEIFGGNKACLSELSEIVKQLRDAWEQIVTSCALALPHFRNQCNIFDGDEYISIFVCNRSPRPWTNASSFIHRIWTSYQNINFRLINSYIQHLPNKRM